MYGKIERIERIEHDWHPMHMDRSYHNEGIVHWGPVLDSKNYPDSPRAHHSMRSST